MKKYELLERTAEIRDRNAIVPGCTANVALSTPGYDDETETHAALPPLFFVVRKDFIACVERYRLRFVTLSKDLQDIGCRKISPSLRRGCLTKSS